MSFYQTQGRIFNIQRFSIHDGPGLRTIVFFKGCYMRCKWCCNPESQEYKIQTLIEKGKPKTVGYDITVEELLPELLADLPYYRRSGGGITLSGGECLAQPEFARDLLRACKEQGLHTAIESTANADTPFGTAGVKPLLVVDVWEHAYYLDWQHQRAAYAKAVVEKHLDWSAASRRFAAD